MQTKMLFSFIDFHAVNDKLTNAQFLPPKRTPFKGNVIPSIIILCVFDHPVKATMFHEFSRRSPNTSSAMAARLSQTNKADFRFSTLPYQAHEIGSRHTVAFEEQRIYIFYIQCIHPGYPWGAFIFFLVCVRLYIVQMN